MSELLGATRVRDLLAEAGVEPSKALGQNFVTDPGTIDRVVRVAGVGPGDAVVEVGPGVGSLTMGLLDAGATVTAIELDRRLAELLDRTVADPGLTVVNADARTVDWVELLGRADSWRLVANLPYNVATPLVLDLLKAAPSIVSFLVMMQREPAERLATEPGHRAGGAPTVKRAWFADAHIAGSVSRTVFHPRPNVDSALLSMVRRTEPEGDRELAFTLVDRAFAQRRKMLRRSLADLLEVDDLAAAGIDPTARPESLTLDQWVALSRRVGDR